MAVRTKGISGLAVAAIGGGAVLVYAAIQDVPITEVFRGLVRGGRPEPLGTQPRASTLQGIIGGAPFAGTVGQGGKAHVTGREKPHVQAEMRFAANTWDIEVYGWRAVGSVPGSDHPKGLAMDCMVYTNQNLGNAIATHYVLNADAKRVKYIIWYKKIWKRSTKKWTNYFGPSPHTDHVHVSFYDFGSSRAV